MPSLFDTSSMSLTFLSLVLTALILLLNVSNATPIITSSDANALDKVEHRPQTPDNQYILYRINKPQSYLPIVSLRHPPPYINVNSAINTWPFRYYYKPASASVMMLRKLPISSILSISNSSSFSQVSASSSYSSVSDYCEDRKMFLKFPFSLCTLLQGIFRTSPFGFNLFPFRQSSSPEPMLLLEDEESNLREPMSLLENGDSPRIVEIEDTPSNDTISPKVEEIVEEIVEDIVNSVVEQQSPSPSPVQQPKVRFQEDLPKESAEKNPSRSASKIKTPITLLSLQDVNSVCDEMRQKIKHGFIRKTKKGFVNSAAHRFIHHNTYEIVDEDYWHHSNVIVPRTRSFVMTKHDLLKEKELLDKKFESLKQNHKTNVTKPVLPIDDNNGVPKESESNGEERIEDSPIPDEIDPRNYENQSENSGTYSTAFKSRELPPEETTYVLVLIISSVTAGIIILLVILVVTRIRRRQLYERNLIGKFEKVDLGNVAVSHPRAVHLRRDSCKINSIDFEQQP